MKPPITVTLNICLMQFRIPLSLTFSPQISSILILNNLFPKKISRLDIIELEEPDIEDLTALFWIILQIETKLSFFSFKQI